MKNQGSVTPPKAQNKALGTNSKEVEITNCLITKSKFNYLNEVQWLKKNRDVKPNGIRKIIHEENEKFNILS